MTKKSAMNAVLFVFLLTLGLSFSSCQKEGVYNPKQKISKIYVDIDYGDEMFFPKQIVQEWTWSNDKLNKVDFYGMSFYWMDDDLELENELYQTDRYFYEKNKLVKIEHGEEYYSKLSYSGSKYKKLESFDAHNNLWLSMDFSYEKNKISKITITQDMDIDVDKVLKMRFLSSFIPKEFVSKVAKKSEESRDDGYIKTTYTVNYSYNGDNIKDVVVQIGYLGMNMEILTTKYLAHDTKQNPYYNKLEISVIEEIMFGLVTVSSKNNPLKAEVVYNENLGGALIENVILEYTYSYVNDFPTEVIEKTTLKDGFSNTNKLYFEYQ